MTFLKAVASQFLGLGTYQKAEKNIRSGSPGPRLDLLEERSLLAAGLIAVGTDIGTPAEVRIFTDRDSNGTYETRAPGSPAPTTTFSPFPGFTGGVRVALGDFDRDGNDELVTAMGPGGSRVIIWDLNSDGTVGAAVDSFVPFPGYSGGVFIATGNLNGGADELVIGSGGGIQSQVKVYSDTNNDGRVSDNLTDLLTPFGASSTIGVRVALGNTDVNAGVDELICGAGPGGGPHVKVFSDSNFDAKVSDNPIIESFLAYGAGFTGGVNVAATPIAGDGNNAAELITAPASGTGRVKIFSDINGNGQASDDPVFESFFAYGPTFTGGVRLAAGDTDNSAATDAVAGGFGELVTAAGPGRGSSVKVRDDSADAGVFIGDDTAADQFSAFASTYTGGAYVAFGQIQFETYANQFQQTIFDDSTTTSRIFVPPGAGVIRDLDVSLALGQPSDTDLDITLTNLATGISLELFSDVAGTHQGFIIRLSDQFPSDIGNVSTTGTSAVLGGFHCEGQNLLSVFNGLDASGEWKLSIVDDTVTGSNGFLVSWSLSITY
jgi:hypothetical protein